jgi:hypothetical protein
MNKEALAAWSSPPATEETGAMGREIESRQSICRVVDFQIKTVTSGQWKCNRWIKLLNLEPSNQSGTRFNACAYPRN